MHGIIFGELKKYVDAKLGGDTWNSLLEEAGLGTKMYMPIKEYPDSEAVAIVAAAATRVNQNIKEVLTDFGIFIAPDLLKLYHRQIDPAWKLLDLIENTEETVHRVVRLRNPGAKPPELRTKRISPDEVVIIYASLRRMCGLAIGIVNGVADQFHEPVEITESTCMNEGDPVCTISVKLTG